jgi:hypothetical protein
MNTQLKNTINNEILAMSERRLNHLMLLSMMYDSESYNQSLGLDIFKIQYYSARKYNLFDLHEKLSSQFKASIYFESDTGLFISQLGDAIVTYWANAFGCYAHNIPTWFKPKYEYMPKFNQDMLDYLDHIQYSDCHSLSDNFCYLAKINGMTDSQYFDYLVNAAYEMQSSAGYADLFRMLQDSAGYSYTSRYSDRLHYYYPAIYQVESSEGLTDCENYFRDSSDYVWGETEEVYIHRYDLMYINGQAYTSDYASENFYYCEACDEYSQDAHEHIHAPSLMSYSTNVLNICGNIFYDDKNRRVSLNSGAWNKKIKPIIFGLELEFFGSEDAVLGDLGTNEGTDWILCSDGSVDGEVKTLPRTLRSWQQNSGLNTVLDALKDNSCSGHQPSSTTSRTAGIHIHVDKRSISLAIIKKFDAVLHNDLNINFFRIIVQRKYDIGDYCSLGDKDNILNIRSYYCDKYLPINYKHDSTYEVRIFNSNLRIERVRKNIEFLHSMFEFLKAVSYADIVSKHINDLGYSDYVRKNKKVYPNLNSFMLEKF